MLTGQDILALRKMLQMGPTEFAQRLGVSPTTVWLWENCKRHPHYDNMVKLNEMKEEAEAALKLGRKKVGAK